MCVTVFAFFTYLLTHASSHVTSIPIRGKDTHFIDMFTRGKE